MARPLRWYDYITINIFFLGLTALSQTNGVVFPLLVQQFVGETQKGTYFGTIRLWTLMVALLTQALWGMLSDHTTLPWGRRRPYIFFGTIVVLLTIVAIASRPAWKAWPASPSSLRRPSSCRSLRTPARPPNRR